MSNLEDRALSVAEQQQLDTRYRKARANLERHQRVETGQAGALMFAAMAYGETLETVPLFRTVSHMAKLFCIASALIIPNLLVIYVLL